MLPKDWLVRLQQKDRKSIAKLITLLEGTSLERNEILRHIYPLVGKAHRIGITGPPGAGKSTLISAWTTYLRSLGLTVGIIAVDPSSPFTGGALLGDRVRMNRHATDHGVWMRSLSNRGVMGGLSLATHEVAHLLDVAGYDVLFLETVGVGQAELEIVHNADTVMLVLPPGAGDGVQIAKAGVMEIADILVVNKADQPFADRLVAELQDVLRISRKKDWTPPIIRTVASQNRGMEELWNAAQTHRGYLQEPKRASKKAENRLIQEVSLYLHQQIRLLVEEELAKPIRRQQMKQIIQTKSSPQDLIDKWWAEGFLSYKPNTDPHSQKGGKT
ncbi:methylmalonyl Co-A mutase-associated GTPase MeaB [Risungbinella massiliensis]|uniref:methylmalonyl Co-A mutase-associated GTPase MeaB n=1 Tax=Risungbinella massiliensis TaxID=1329796 RepID=UPI000699BD95|nr:methylmalonyl Co-A mutase-associated GTPase MeaB [Risungbinella massiliensis]